MYINKLLYFFIILNFSLVLAQEPNISYTTPNSFEINQPITPLFPGNSGGAIPNGPGIIRHVGNGLQGDVNGFLEVAEFNLPTASIFDSNNNLLIVDRGNHKIKKIDASGIVQTFVGTGALGALDGSLAVATFNYPASIVEDSQGNLFVCDQSNHKIRKIDASGNVTTFAGTGVGGFQDGPGNVARFYYPDEIAIDALDNIFVADYLNNRIRKITPLGIVSTVAGSGVSGDMDGIASLAKFKWPTGVCLDGNGNIFVTDYGNHKIKKIDTSANVTTIAGSVAGDENGIGTLAKFKNPTISALDSFGNIFVADYGNHKIKKIDTSGNVTTFAGDGTIGNRDDELLLAKFKQPSAVTFNNSGELFITDYGNHTIKKTTVFNFTYSVTPNLPVGLIFNENTGEISGIPTQLSPMTDYTVSISNQFGTSSTIVSIEVATLSANSFQQKAFKVYPNPFENDVVFEFKNEIPKEVVFYNTFGQKIVEVQPTDLFTKIDFKNHNSGVYFVKLNFDSKTETLQLIKK
ncbi:hypothetical protein KK2020170_05970 [Flavobacterium okayamense]|uniref:Secretion system C-terminal sorting domain-containing protein n=1 Tax=Flavobacterium okayamense TaxID=2830782 RepID=A0ABM7SA66_9FLAO|nr:hypothetical protein KK2020170_05970 [Flavobacterium okayamense]